MNSRRYSILSSGGSNIPNYTPEQLRKIRGALFTGRAQVEFGPRPNDPTNCFMFGSLIAGAYKDGSVQRVYDSIKTNKYTHVAMGSFVDPGYHGQIPAIDFRTNPDLFANNIETAYKAGLIPVYFVSPDNWTLDQLKTLEVIHKSPRWQALIKMHVIEGFEPSEDRANSEHVAFLKYGRELFPKSLSYLHLAANFDAPGNNQDLTPGTPYYIGNAGCWCNVAPYLHGFAGQYGPFGKRVQDDSERANEFAKLFKENRFKSGYAGWPTYSAWGPKEPLDYGYAEGCSYTAWNSNFPEPYCKEWGNLALQSGAAFVFDGLDM